MFQRLGEVNCILGSVDLSILLSCSTCSCSNMLLQYFQVRKGNAVKNCVVIQELEECKHN
jgi:hypothetical protein